MQELVSINSGELLASGIFPSLEADAAPLWVAGENVLFSNGGVRKARGLLGLENLAVQPTGLKSTYADGEARCFIGGGTKAYRYRPADGLTEIGTFAGSGIYQFVPWDTWCLISNGVDPVELWQNAGASAPITAPFTRANTLFNYQLQAFAGGTDNGGTLVEWSPINSVTDWTTSLTGTAGNLRLRQLESDIVCARPINGAIGIYSRSQGGLFVYSGGTNPYLFRNPIKGVGALSPYSIVSDGVKHWGLLKDFAFVTDLVSAVPIDEPAMRRWLEENVNWDRETEVYGWMDRANSMVRWAVPIGASGFKTIGYRYDTGAWTCFNDSVLAGEESGAFDNMFLAKAARLLRHDVDSVNNDGSAYSSYVQTKPLDLGAKENFKRVSKLAFKGYWTGSVKVYLGNSDSANGPVTWEPSFNIDNFIYPDQLGLRSEFHYLSVKIETTAADADWRLQGAAIFGDVTAHVN